MSQKTRFSIFRYLSTLLPIAVVIAVRSAFAHRTGERTYPMLILAVSDSGVAREALRSFEQRFTWV